MERRKRQLMDDHRVHCQIVADAFAALVEGSAFVVGQGVFDDFDDAVGADNGRDADE